MITAVKIKKFRILLFLVLLLTCGLLAGCKNDGRESETMKPEKEPKYKDVLADTLVTDEAGNSLSVTFLREDLVSFYYSPKDEVVEATYHQMIEKGSEDYAPVHGLEEDDPAGGKIIRTEGLTVSIGKDLGITVADPDGKVIFRSAAQAFKAEGEGKTASFVRDLNGEEHFFGLGNDVGDAFKTIDHRGSVYSLWLNDDNVHAIIPLWYSSSGYGVFLNNSNKGQVSFKEDYSLSVEDGRMHFYFFYGPAPRTILENWSELAGRMAMPPLYALGLTYRGFGSWTEDQLYDAIVKQLDAGIAIDVAGVEPGWQTATYPCSYEWSPKFTFDPAAFTERMHALGLRVNLWEHPYVSPKAEIYEDMSRYSLKSEVLGTRDWEGHSGGQYGFGGLIPDMTIEKARELYAGIHVKNLLSIGVDGFKVDETDSWGANNSLTTRFPGGISANAYHNLLGTLTVNLLHDTYRNEYGKRAFLFSRGNYTGMQRYATSAYTDYYGYDQFVMSVIVQGFSGTYYTPEIRDVSTPSDVSYMRRAELMFLTPFAMSNEWATEATVLDRSRTVIECYQKYNALHYALIPYQYSLFWEQHNTGVGVTRPLMMEFPDDPRAWKVNDEFMLGPSLLVCPVSSTARTATESLYLPAGANWIDYNTGKVYEGGKTLNYTSAASVLPLFVRVGSIIPLGSYGANTQDVTDPTLRLDIYPAETETTFTVYEDDGISYEYENGKYALTPVSLKGESGKITVKLGERTGSFAVASRNVELQIHTRCTPTEVKVDNTAAKKAANRAEYDAASGPAWFYDDAAENDIGLILYVRFADDGKAHEVIASVGAESPEREPVIITDGTLYECEDDRNTFNGVSVNRNKNGASGNAIVGAVGDDGKKSLTMNGVKVPEDGTYDVEIVFYNGSSEARNLAVTVNGGDTIPLRCPTNGDWERFQSVTLPLTLKNGENSIFFTTREGEGYAPDLDCIFVYDKAPVETGMKGDLLLPTAENLSGSLKLIPMAGAAGGNAVLGIGSSEDSVLTYRVTVPKTAPYQLCLNYSNPSEAGKKLNLSINGQKSELTLPGTLSTHIFAVLNQTVYLEEGENVISFWFDGSISLYECEVGGEYNNCNNRLTPPDENHTQSGGYAVGATASDGKASFTMKGIRVPEAGTYKVLLYVGSGDTRTFRVKVNGEDTGEKYSAQTGHFHNFKPVTLELNLKAGDNTITIWQKPKSEGDSEWLPNFDYLVLPDVTPDYEILLGAVSVR